MVETTTTPKNALSAPLQEIARSYVAARARFGVALLEAAQHLATARETCKHGEWHIFLDATRTSHDQAEALLAIHTQSQSDPVFADACRRGFLTFSTARELTSAPPEVREKALIQSNPPTVQQLRDEKRAANAAISRHLDQPPAAPDLADILLRLDAHGYAKTSTRQKGMTRFHSFRDYSGRSDETGGEIELAEGELPLWLSELDSSAAYAQAKQERSLDAQARAARLGYDLRRDGSVFLLTPAGRQVPALRGSLDQLITVIEGYERNAAKQAAPTLAALDSSFPKDLEKAGYYWKSASPIVIAHNDGWTGDAQTAEQALTLARARMAAPVRLTCPTCGEIIMNGIWGDLKECGQCYHARQRAQPATPALATDPDPRTQIAVLLTQIAPLLQGLTTDDQEGLGQAIADLNECLEGTEAVHWLKVGYALLDLEVES